MAKNALVLDFIKAYTVNGMGGREGRDRWFVGTIGWGEKGGRRLEIGDHQVKWSTYQIVNSSIGQLVKSVEVVKDLEIVEGVKIGNGEHFH
jgi:hypothetical protein